MSIDYAYVYKAYELEDPDLLKLFLELTSDDSVPQTALPPEVKTWSAFKKIVAGWSYLWADQDEKRKIRSEWWSALEAPDALAPLPERLRLHELLMALWQDQRPFARSCLLDLISDLPLKWGPWRGFKAIFKEAEERGDHEVYFALGARFDELASKGSVPWGSEVSLATLEYLRRRAWRYLRQLGRDLPSAYPDAAVDALRFYSSDSRWHGMWLANHILFHESGNYGRKGFNLGWSYPKDLVENRAFDELWKRSPRPLFRLLELARTEKPRIFAVESMKRDFKDVLREVEASWVARLVGVKSAVVDDFMIWILENVPRFSQDSFRELGLHEPVLELLESPSGAARIYAEKYARANARDITIERLIPLANSSHDIVRKFACDLLVERDPRVDVGLDNWGALLGTKYGHQLAVDAIKKHFGVNELTPDWFTERLLSENAKVQEFVVKLLPEIHDYESLGAALYFLKLFDEERLEGKIAKFALKIPLAASKSEDSVWGDGLAENELELMRRLLIHPHASRVVQNWVSEDRIRASDLGVDFIKALAFHRDWERQSWIASIRSDGPKWALDLEFNSELATQARQWLEDSSRFAPADVGVPWLLNLINEDEEYSVWSSEYLLSAFNLEDFAEGGASSIQGVQVLWDMATLKGPEDQPRSVFARAFLLSRHPDIGPKKTGVAIAETRAVPQDFLSFERVTSVLTDERQQVRRFALEFAQWEFARWQPSLAAILPLLELAYPEVDDLCAKAILGTGKPTESRLNLDAQAFDAEEAYAFCDSMTEGAREVGMQMIRVHSHLARPDKFLELTESPDRQMQAFAIRGLWSAYRCSSDSSTSELPASAESLMELMRMVLFGIPPSRMPKRARKRKQRALPARLAKRQIVEVMRDLAISQHGFATLVVPLLTEFMDSHGPSEEAACLVALARIGQSHPSLQSLEGVAS